MQVKQYKLNKKKNIAMFLLKQYTVALIISAFMFIGLLNIGYYDSKPVTISAEEITNSYIDCVNIGNCEDITAPN